MANVLLNAERQGQISTADVEGFISQLDNLPINTDDLTAVQVLNRTLALARAYKISSYDAAYLELAVRNQVPLATLDKDLSKAAKKAEVALYQPS